jgi:NADPH:quinone reductase-like Zn-dependent oxidoreductase
VGLNGLDWKNRAFGIMIQAWPAVLGVDAAGVVEAVGDEVTAFQPGDEVFSLAGMEPKAGAFQELFTVPAHFVGKKPSALTFEQAASLP